MQAVLLDSRVRSTVVVLAIFLVSACGTTEPAEGGSSAAATSILATAGPASTAAAAGAGASAAGTSASAAAGVAASGHKACAPHPFVGAEPGSWRHTRSELVVSTGDPGHAASDVLTPPGAAFVVESKFVYGVMSKDLENELVVVFVDTCAGWIPLGEGSTDGDGRLALDVAAVFAPGEYGLRFQVVGDASTAEATLFIRPAGTKLSIFDVDGTLTIRDEELFKELGSSMIRADYAPVPFAGGPALTKLRVARGHFVVYLTGRPYQLQAQTRKWLVTQGFASGALFLARHAEDVVTTTGGVGAFKLRVLRRLAEQGYVLAAAHGNAATDIYAYLEAGIPASSVWIIGEYGGERGTHKVTGAWTGVVGELEAESP